MTSAIPFPTTLSPDAALAAAEAFAELGVAQANEAYQLSKTILQDQQWELLPALVALVGLAITEGYGAWMGVNALAELCATEVEEGAAAAREAVERVFGGAEPTFGPRWF